jgi:PAS domain-containing protein
MNSSESAIRRLMDAAFLTERVSDEHFGKLLTLSYEPMLAWKLDGPIEFWNAGAERLYGFSPGEAIGQSSHAILQTKFPSSLPLAKLSSGCVGWRPSSSRVTTLS